MKRGIIVLTCLVLACGVSAANPGGRPDKDWKSFFGHFATGMFLPQGDVNKIVDDELYFNGGFTYWPEEWPAGLTVDLGYTETDIKRSVINAINSQLAAQIPPAGSISGGEVEFWSLSTNVVWGPDSDGPVGFYVTGGVGLDYIDGKITDNGLVYYPPICDPWFWWCIPGGVGPGTITVLSEDTTEFSWNAGLGVTFDLNSGSQIFIEARYESAETSRASTEYAPIVVGIRW